MNKQYLINKLQEYYNTFGWVPDQRDVQYTFDYPNPKQYVKEFGSWTNALEAAGFNPEIAKYTYTSEELAGALWDYYYTYGKYPSSVDIDDNPNYPASQTFINRFGSWDLAYQYAEMPRSAQTRSD